MNTCSMSAKNRIYWHSALGAGVNLVIERHVARQNSRSLVRFLVMEIRAFIVFLYFLWPCSLLAQIVDIQAESNERPKSGLSGAFATSWDRQTGNTELSRGAVSVLARLHEDPHTLLLMLKREYGQKAGDEYVNNYFYHLRHRYGWSQFTALEVFFQSDHNRFRGYRERKLLGAGPLLRWLDSDDLVLYTGLALMKEREILTAATMGSDGAGVVYADRLSLSLSYSQKPLTQMSLSLSLYYQPSLNDVLDRRLAANSGIGLQVTRSLSYQLMSTILYDSKTPEGIEELDLSFEHSLKLVF